MAHTRCFNNGLPNLSTRDYTRNKKQKTLYNYYTQLTAAGKTQNATNTTEMDCSAILTRTSSFAMLTNLKYGQALCAPCDASGGCDCLEDICGNLTEIAWKYTEPPESWNAGNVVKDGAGITYWTLCGPSGSDLTWDFDGSANLLDNSGGSMMDASGVCVNGTGNCGTDPPHKAILDGTMKAYEASYTYTDARPTNSMYNYLRGGIGGRIRFYR